MSETTLVLSDLEIIQGAGIACLWSKTIYEDNGVVIALQATLASNRARSWANIKPHTHEFDEIIYALSGHYGEQNKEAAEQLTNNLRRIPKDTEHGGRAYGTWISIKPVEYDSLRLNKKGEKVALEYFGKIGLEIIFGTNSDILNTGTLDLLVLPDNNRVTTYQPKIEDVPMTKNVSRYVALRYV
jgi:hypothetical protein